MTMTSPSVSADELAELRSLTDDICSTATEPVLDLQRRDIAFDPKLWSDLTEAGLTLLSTPEEHGGSGAGLLELAVVLEQLGYHAAPAPIAENDLLASWLLQTAGLPVATGVMTAAHTAVAPADGRLGVTLESVPWARHADTLVIAGPGFVTAVPAAALTVSQADDIAAQPLDRVDVDIATDSDTFATLDADLATEFRLRGALARALQTCGALNRALEMTVRHVSERVQFGRPLAKFQAVQSLVAGSASALCLVRSAADFAVDMAQVHGFDSEQARFAIAVAKIESGRAATIVSRNTHQAHGAIGFTLDHRLRHFTGRALAWRSEFGGTRQWQQELGQAVLESGSTAWEFVTSRSTSF
ncbi:acyl-CoA/acyl-ACP dehydrogenase [Mycobacterium sp. NBC_00419]|uniref:acyl-CoA dehydrogenase family protein n=1 Tax=Mycobacterium sp. NBC_00419 TaxID=2975989 RepID=UPI002E203C70